MSHGPNEHQDNAYEPGSDADVNVATIIFTGIIGSVLILVIIMALKALYYTTQHEELAEKSANAGDINVSDVKASQLEQLGGLKWRDPKAGVVTIPVAEAMDLVVAAHASEGSADYGVMAERQIEDLVPGNLRVLGAEKILGPGAAAPPASNTDPSSGDSSTEHVSDGGMTAEEAEANEAAAAEQAGGTPH
jgi:hypothetical protein